MDDRDDNKAKNPNWIAFLNRQKKKGIEVKYLHTSGHASAKMLAEVINKVNPQEEIIPMHTEYPEEFMNLDISEELKGRL